MKIALISQPGEVAAPVKQRGSIGIWSEQVCRRLIPADQVVFYGNQKRGSSSPAAIALMDEGIEYRGVRGRLDQVLRPLRVLDRWGISNPQRPIFASTFYGRGYIGQIARDLSQQHCNIAHVHNYSQFVPALKRMNPQIKTVLHMHCEWLTQLDPDLIASRLHHTDLVIGCSDYITQKIRDRFPAFADRCQTVYNGVDPVLFTPASSPRFDRPPQLLYVGRVSPEKGVHLLIEAFCQIAPQYPGIELKIVGSEAVPGRELLVQLSQDPEVAALARFYGDGSYLQQLKQRVPQEFRPQVHFVGAVPYQKLSPFYQNADILINPSLSEAFGMSLVEAMANEVPTIGARVGGMTTVIRPGETGLLFESDQVDQLAQAILKLLANPELRRSMGLIGRQRVIDLFSWDRVADSLQKHYQDLV